MAPAEIERDTLHIYIVPVSRLEGRTDAEDGEGQRESEQSQRERASARARVPSRCRPLAARGVSSVASNSTSCEVDRREAEDLNNQSKHLNKPRVHIGLLPARALPDISGLGKAGTLRRKERTAHVM